MKGSLPSPVYGSMEDVYSLWAPAAPRQPGAVLFTTSTRSCLSWAKIALSSSEIRTWLQHSWLWSLGSMVRRQYTGQRGWRQDIECQCSPQLLTISTNEKYVNFPALLVFLHTSHQSPWGVTPGVKLDSISWFYNALISSEVPIWNPRH